MDDSCAVCADALEWVAYGACGHKDVCSTCVARLRFICNDRRCCICKMESSVVFVTKALGNYTRVINDFSVLPSEVKEGRVGSYWYHEDTQALFDDFDHYKMIKAMCRLSCSVCDRAEDQPSEGPRRKGRFRNIEQLKGHLFHQHKLLMCSLCLEGRKVFICEQKLYSRAQLNQHISTGDSDVDGTESERGGFMGHPMCEFCRSPFYGDNELYTHMSTEHYTCHICQRQHPGQYEYYKNYDDLEIHFGREHFLCEDEACLAKKFVVFQTEAEMKRHNTIEHGGRMSRSKRNAALQIPTSFRYHHGNEDNRRGRRRSFLRDSSDDATLSMAIQASFETANAIGRKQNSSASDTELSSDYVEGGGIDSIIQPFESLDATDSDPPSRYLQALSQRSRNSKLEESSFPPLPNASSQPKPNNGPEGLPQNTIAAHLRRQKNRNATVFNSDQVWPQASREASSSSSSLGQIRPLTIVPPGLTTARTQKKMSDNDSKQAWPSASRRPAPPVATQTHVRPTSSIASVVSSTSAHTEQVKETVKKPSTFPSLLEAQMASIGEPSFAGSTKSSKTLASSSRISHSSSAPNLSGSGSLESDFLPVSTAQMRNLPTTQQAVSKGDSIHTANKSLVEKIRFALENDQDKYTAFKDISGEYRQGLLDAGTYLTYVEQFGLSHLVLELASLCPDPKKQKELVETYNASLAYSSREIGNGRGSKKGKGKMLDSRDDNPKDKLADSFLSTVRKLQSNYKPSQENVEVLLKDGYRAAKGSSKVVGDDEPPEGLLSQPLKFKSHSNQQSSNGGADQSLGDGDGDGKSKQRKKSSKFLRVRLGDGSMSALTDLKNADPDPSPEPSISDVNKTTDGLFGRGVWQNGGGQKLFVNDSKKAQR